MVLVVLAAAKEVLRGMLKAKRPVVNAVSILVLEDKLEDKRDECAFVGISLGIPKVIKGMNGQKCQLSCITLFSLCSCHWYFDQCPNLI